MPHRHRHQHEDDPHHLANVDLQNVLTRRQQSLAVMSNVMKRIHDAQQAVIRKIK